MAAQRAYDATTDCMVPLTIEERLNDYATSTQADADKAKLAQRAIKEYPGVLELIQFVTGRR